MSTELIVEMTQDHIDAGSTHSTFTLPHALAWFERTQNSILGPIPKRMTYHDGSPLMQFSPKLQWPQEALDSILAYERGEKIYPARYIVKLKPEFNQ